MTTLARILYVIRWPFALVVTVALAPITFAGALLVADPEPLAEWWSWAEYALFSWPRREP